MTDPPCHDNKNGSIITFIIPCHSYINSFRLTSLNEFGLISLWKKRRSPNKAEGADFSDPTGNYQVVTLYDVAGAFLILSFGLFAAFSVFIVEVCLLFLSTLIALKKTKAQYR